MGKNRLEYSKGYFTPTSIMSGTKWKLTEIGIFILKQKATRVLNSFNNYQTRPIPIRLDNPT